MKSKKNPVFYLLVFSGIILLLILVMQPLEIIQFEKYIAILFPKGTIALEQRNLLYIIQALMFFVIVPVYILTFYFTWRYSVHNPKGKYEPDLVDSHIAEMIWWGFPLIMTLIIAGITLVKTHELDPYKPIKGKNEEMTIQAVALDWKWLFIYPEEKLAVVNFLQFPVDTPLHFEITADAPMNAFWIPHLGGMIYAMPKMRTELYLIANQEGDFRGSSANISGNGFSGMHFISRASTEEEYKNWVQSSREKGKPLNVEEYEKLAEPTENNPVQYYTLEDENLFNYILNKYMHPQEK